MEGKIIIFVQKHFMKKNLMQIIRVFLNLRMFARNCDLHNLTRCLIYFEMMERKKKH